MKFSLPAFGSSVRHHLQRICIEENERLCLLSYHFQVGWAKEQLVALCQPTQKQWLALQSLAWLVVQENCQAAILQRSWPGFDSLSGPGVQDALNGNLGEWT